MLQVWFDSFTTAAFARNENFDLTPWVVKQKNLSGYPDLQQPKLILRFLLGKLGSLVPLLQKNCGET